VVVDGPLEEIEPLRKGFLESLLEVFGEDGVGTVVVDAEADVEGGRKRDPGPVSSDG
jgi:hypothetical protein